MVAAAVMVAAAAEGVQGARKREVGSLLLPGQAGEGDVQVARSQAGSALRRIGEVGLPSSRALSVVEWEGRRPRWEARWAAQRRQLLRGQRWMGCPFLRHLVQMWALVQSAPDEQPAVELNA